MKRAWKLGAATAIVLSIGSASEKPELTETSATSAASIKKSDQFLEQEDEPRRLARLRPDLGRGQVSQPAAITDAFKFGGNTGDQVIIDVTSKNGDAWPGWSPTASRCRQRTTTRTAPLNSHIDSDPARQHRRHHHLLHHLHRVLGRQRHLHVSLALNGAWRRSSAGPESTSDGSSPKCRHRSARLRQHRRHPLPSRHRSCVDNPTTAATHQRPRRLPGICAPHHRQHASSSQPLDSARYHCVTIVLPGLAGIACHRVQYIPTRRRPLRSRPRRRRLQRYLTTGPSPASPSPQAQQQHLRLAPARLADRRRALALAGAASLHSFR